jgi:hypothetical protein
VTNKYSLVAPCISQNVAKTVKLGTARHHILLPCFFNLVLCSLLALAVVHIYWTDAVNIAGIMYGLNVMNQPKKLSLAQDN